MNDKPDHEAAREWAESDQRWRCLYPGVHNLARCYLDALDRAERAEAERRAIWEAHVETDRRMIQFKEWRDTAERERDEARAKLAAICAVWRSDENGDAEALSHIGAILATTETEKR